MSKFYLALTMCLLLLAACRSNKPILSGSKTLKDSAHVERTIAERDTTMWSQPAHSEAEVEVDVVTTIVSVKRDSTVILATDKSGHSTSKLLLDKGKLKADCQCDSAAITAKLKDTFEKSYRSSQQRETITVTQTVNKPIPVYIKVLACVGGLYLIIFIISLVVRWKSG